MKTRDAAALSGNRILIAPAVVPQISLRGGFAILGLEDDDNVLYLGTSGFGIDPVSRSTSLLFFRRNGSGNGSGPHSGWQNAHE
ncbi:MAG: hypothetical protein C7B43_19075 [Sulfobacillus benefaciens]|uniref:Uncharacterized protein n=1 Tax=Sulfobacillus benefaciens TaxID=453960 RepID=A0A2T2WQ98_9FIRM|nr:MAG: hypothetical protein C7B43_19075 [Sulfobacillus benefaciens]